MSMSLRDQLLQAGLVSPKQAREAERQVQRQEQLQRRQPKHSSPQHPHPQHPAAAHPAATAPRATPSPATPPQPHPGRGPTADQVSARTARSAQLARDQALNRRQQEKAQKKALQAQIKQLIERNRLPSAETGEGYNFVDGNKIRCITVQAESRGALSRGEIAIVRHEARYYLVAAAVAARIRERDESAVIAIVAPQGSATDDAYRDFCVPDDLIW